MFYFSTAAAPPPAKVDEVRQLYKVVRFRQRLEKLNLIWTYEGPTKFADAVRAHLMNVIAELVPARPQEPVPRPRVEERPPASAPLPTSPIRITAIAEDDA